MAGITIASRPPDVRHVAREAAGVRAGGPGTRVLTHCWALLRRIPWVLPRTGAWTWRGSALLAAVLLHPYVLVLAVQHTAADRVSVAGTMSLLLVQVSVLASAVVLMYDWRISRRATIGWLAMTLAFIAAQHVPFALLAVEGAPEGRYGFVMGVTQLPSTLVVLALVVLAARGTSLPAGNPLTTGLLLGALFGAARFVLIGTGIDPTLRLTGVADLAVVGMVVVASAGIVAAIVRMATLPGWARLRTVVFLVCMVSARVLSTGRDHAGSSSGLPSPLAVAVAVVGTVALGSAAATMLRETINDNARRLVNLAHRAASAEVSARHGQEKLHELNATVAGVAQASRLLVRNGGPNRAQRRRLESLLETEMARLERMLARRGQQPVSDLYLDDVLLPLVESQRTLGTDVSFRPSGLRAQGRPDDVAEVVHILLSNVARHAPGARVTISAERYGSTVEVRVCDDGPGVPAELHDSLFAWGTRSAKSPGQGIGLQLAKRLMLEQAGNLTLESTGRPGGATFVLTIPGSPPGLS
ncbi:sensor histidine kinase [Nocardioides ungokensis]